MRHETMAEGDTASAIFAYRRSLIRPYGPTKEPTNRHPLDLEEWVELEPEQQAPRA